MEECDTDLIAGLSELNLKTLIEIENKKQVLKLLKLKYYN